jgi:type IV secretory pathway TrbL component
MEGTQSAAGKKRTMKRNLLICLGLLIFCVMPGSVHAQTGTAFGDAVIQEYSQSALTWVSSIQAHAENLFWILAVISAAWTFAVLVLRQSDLADFVGAAVRYILTTMFFYWLLVRGKDFALAILASTWQLAQLPRLFFSFPSYFVRLAAHL